MENKKKEEVSGNSTSLTLSLLRSGMEQKDKISRRIKGTNSLMPFRLRSTQQLSPLLNICYCLKIIFTLINNMLC